MLRSTIIIVVFHFETHVYTVRIVFPLPLKKSPSSNSNVSFNVLRLGSSSKPNIVSLVRCSQEYQERSSPIFVDSIFTSFAFLRSSRIDADRFVASFYEIERNARAHLSPRYHRRARHRCGWKGISSSIDTRREEGCDRTSSERIFRGSSSLFRARASRERECCVPGERNGFSTRAELRSTLGPS